MTRDEFIKYIELIGFIKMYINSNYVEDFYYMDNYIITLFDKQYYLHKGNLERNLYDINNIKPFIKMERTYKLRKILK